MPVTGGGAHVLSECQTSGAGVEHGRLSFMRIAQVCPLYESCPPRLYGGTERIVYYLTDPAWTRGDPVCERGFADLGFARSALRTGLTTQRDLQGPAHLPHDDAAPGAPPRR